MAKIETYHAGELVRSIYEAPEVEVCFFEPENMILAGSNIFIITDWDEDDDIGGDAEQRPVYKSINGYTSVRYISSGSWKMVGADQTAMTARCWNITA